MAFFGERGWERVLLEGALLSFAFLCRALLCMGRGVRWWRVSPFQWVAYSTLEPARRGVGNRVGFWGGEKGGGWAGLEGEETVD